MDHKKIESKWQKKWEDSGIFKVGEDPKKPKYYVLEMFPYPSGSGLHMGHAFNYTIGDVYSRLKRMQGFNVLYPMGYDSFGLPAENAAIQANIHPKKYTEKAISMFISQQKSLGLSYDWSRMVSTCTPEYYKWNQFLFLKFMEKGLVYRKKAPVNWCPECKTVLANEQVHDGRCWRHEETEVEQRDLEQWFLKTTKYAEELLDDLEKLEWPERIKIMQKNWIGKSEGVNIKFKIKGSDETIETFTTRHDTMYGMTFIVIAPEHPKVLKWVKGTKYEKQTLEFIEKVKKENMIERTTTEKKEKRGVFIGKYAIHPLSGKGIPIYAADFVLLEFGTGIVQAVPAHDQRDFDFAKEHNLPVIVTIQPDDYKISAEKMDKAYEGYGTLVNSEEFNGMCSEEALEKIADKLEKISAGKRTTAFKLKDWLISRQRYWGTPIPVVYCDKCGIVPVPEKDLPVMLPEKVKFGEGNPLKTSSEFVNTTCPKCRKKALRETDTMDTFFDSSWYFLRYCDSKNEKRPFDRKKAEYWMPVNQYIGGAEHACMHLIYARFFIKALRDMGFVNIDEPFPKLFNQGMLHGEDGYVMSKSRGNVVLPEEVSENYGIDTARFFLMSIASPDKDLAWSDRGIQGSLRFVNRVLNYFSTVKTGKSGKKVESKLNKSIKDITEDLENFRYNFALIKIRQLFESLEKEVSKDTLEKFLKLLHPFCPHITEELWEKVGNKPFISLASWPVFDESKIDKKSESLDKMIEQTKEDIASILELTKIEKPKKISLWVAENWKYDLFREVKKQIEKTRDIGSVMKAVMQNKVLKPYGSEISKMVPNLVKNPEKMPDLVLDQKIELETLNEAKNELETHFGCRIEISKSDGSRSDRAKKSMPGKPGIEIV